MLHTINVMFNLSMLLQLYHSKGWSNRFYVYE